jgi:hypothetical protein
MVYFYMKIRPLAIPTAKLSSKKMKRLTTRHGVAYTELPIKMERSGRPTCGFLFPSTGDRNTIRFTTCPRRLVLNRLCRRLSVMFGS